MFDRIIHADWSKDARKRWMAVAERCDGTWQVGCPRPVGPPATFLNHQFGGPHARTLMGFDFPIGLPEAYGATTGFSQFLDALAAFGEGQWSDFFNVAALPQEISAQRPFYPNGSTKGVTRASLVTALGVRCFDDLLRRCELRSDAGRQGCSLFWTLGGNQVGKAAISGWQEVVRPAMLRGARLWPYQGSLLHLAREPGIVIAETYPALAYSMVGAQFSPGESKRRQVDRKSKAIPMRAWTQEHNVALSNDAKAALLDGFGPRESGEDPFDAFAGLLKMIEVVEGRRVEAPSNLPPRIVAWEGWILGR